MWAYLGPWNGGKLGSVCCLGFGVWAFHCYVAWTLLRYIGVIYIYILMANTLYTLQKSPGFRVSDLEV